MNISQTYKATPHFITKGEREWGRIFVGMINYYAPIVIVRGTHRLLMFIIFPIVCNFTTAEHFAATLDTQTLRETEWETEKERELLSLKLSQMKSHNTDISTDKHPFIAVKSGILFWTHWAPK